VLLAQTDAGAVIGATGFGEELMVIEEEAEQPIESVTVTE
jgi:hypothetical protein